MTSSFFNSYSLGDRHYFFSNKKDDQKLDNNYINICGSSIDLRNLEKEIEAMESDSTLRCGRSDYKNNAVNTYTPTINTRPKKAVESKPLAKIVARGKFRGAIDDRQERCPHQIPNCAVCKHLVISPSRLRQVITAKQLLKQSKNLSKKKSFSNLASRFNSRSDENLYSPLEEGAEEEEDIQQGPGYVTYANSFRKKLHYYKELNGLKLRGHLGTMTNVELQKLR